MAKFTTAGDYRFEQVPSEEEPEEPTVDAVTSFIENDALFIVLIAVVALFIAFQFGRWALSRHQGEIAEDQEEDPHTR